MEGDVKVAAVVVTYNRKELLRECLNALLNQTRPLDEIIVIDNASTDGTQEMIAKEFPHITYVRMSENIGGAGGFHEGMKLAYEKGYDWIWIMDDDAIPDLRCLEKLLQVTNLGDVLVPVLIDSIGRRYGAGYWQGHIVPASLEGEGLLKVETFSFVGPLIRSDVIAKVGLPRTDFFIWGDDTEYSLRIRKSGYKVLAVKDAIIYHDYGEKPKKLKRLGRVSIRNPQPAWKHYYGARNYLLMIKTLDFKERVIAYLFAIYYFLRYTLGDILYERDWKVRLLYRWLGFLHGLLGITGKTIIGSNAKQTSKVQKQFK